MDEFALIRMLTERGSASQGIPGHGVIVGVGDDAAVVEVKPGFQLVLACDTMVEEVHFKSVTMKDFDIGFKAMASNVSDIAAMGAIPRFALVSLSAPRTISAARLKEIYNGLYACADQFEVAIVGGDTTSSPHQLIISVTIIGEIEQGRALLRTAARTGDAVFISGFPGCSAAGLHYLLGRNEKADVLQDTRDQLPHHIVSLIEAHQRPMPQVKAGRLLLQSGFCHALNDVSDGLASEAWEIAESSSIGIEIYENVIPIHEHLGTYAHEIGKDPLDWILYGGEDYHLIGTVPTIHISLLQKQFELAGLPLFVIGEVTDHQAGVSIKRGSGQMESLEKSGFNHFSI